MDKKKEYSRNFVVAGLGLPYTVYALPREAVQKLSAALIILSYPFAFLYNLDRTAKIMAHKYETFNVVRESGGLEVRMRRPLDPEGTHHVL